MSEAAAAPLIGAPAASAPVPEAPTEKAPEARSPRPRFGQRLYRRKSQTQAQDGARAQAKQDRELAGCSFAPTLESGARRRERLARRARRRRARRAQEAQEARQEEERLSRTAREAREQDEERKVFWTAVACGPLFIKA